MKVAHVFKIKAVSGSENHLLTLLPPMVVRGVKVIVIMLVEPGTPVFEFSEVLETQGIKVYRVEIGAHISFAAFTGIVKVLKSEKPDLVHTHLIHGDLYGTLAARWLGIKKIVSSKHNDDRFRRKVIIQWMNRFLNRRVAAVIVISHALKDFCIGFEKIHPPKIKVIHYGLEGFSNRMKNKDLRQTLGYEDDQVLFGIIARLTEQKGHIYLLEAFKKLAADYPRARLLIVGNGELDDSYPLSVIGPGDNLIVGNGELDDSLKKMTRQLNLEGRVSFLGRREDTADLYNAFDIFVHPSLWEGFGLVFLEAMTFSLPVVATGVSAIPELIVDGETGILVPPAEVEGLARAMAWMMDNPKERILMGEKGARRLKESFGMDKMVDETLSVYRGLYEG